MGQRLVGRFLSVGFVVSLATYGLYLGLLLFMRPGMAFACSYFIGLALNYLLSSLWVFRRKLSFSRVLPFTLMHLFIVVVGVAGVSLAVEVFRISKFFAPFVVLPLTSAISFLLQTQIFKDRHEQSSVLSARPKS